ncbi:MAG: 50S ribosomal protein L18Ae [Archaeoglobaceae archaeon]
MRFEVVGKFKTPEGWQKFRKIVEAPSEKFALEKVYSLIGSNHKVQRHLIKIEDMKKVSE